MPVSSSGCAPMNIKSVLRRAAPWSCESAPAVDTANNSSEIINLISSAVRGGDPQHAVERIGGLVDECLGVMKVGMKVFEGETAAVAGGVERFEDGWPVGGAVEEGAETFE